MNGLNDYRERSEQYREWLAREDRRRKLADLFLLLGVLIIFELLLMFMLWGWLDGR